MLGGYAGKVAWIDLTRGDVREEPLSEPLLRKYLGGKALGAELLYRHLRPGVEPYDPENLLIYVTGPLTGTAFPATSRSAIVTRSPMTGTFLDSYSGGYFGPHLKFAGYDALLIRGKSPKPAYLLVEQGKISLRSAEHLWGLLTSETEDRLREELGSGGRVSVAAIGPAGEKRVRFAAVLNDRRAYGRGGTGAVMGSKNLKAVAVVGPGELSFSDRERFRELTNRTRGRISEHPFVGKTGAFAKAGTMATLDLTQETGTLPTRNWTENTSPRAQEINADAFLALAVRQQACWACPIGCSRETRATLHGRETLTEGPEYETMYAFGTNCDVHDPAVIIRADRLCDDYGLDAISCGAAIGFAMECFEAGLLSPEETEGLALRFGDGDTLLRAVDLIAAREGIGRLLGEGVKRASERIRGSEGRAVHVKGLELPGYDPRGMKGQGLSYAVSDRGGCHLRSNTLRTELLGLPKPIDRYGYEEKAAMVRELQLTYATLDSLIGCVFGAFAVTMEDYAEAVAAATGFAVGPAELRKVGERAWNLSRLFNVREGFGRKDDTLPPRLFTEPSTSGPSKGEVVERAAFERMLDEYYGVVGWDPQTGVPLPAKLAELELEG
jgi:aldehyde:ferredoxin oxidoreductase